MSWNSSNTLSRSSALLIFLWKKLFTIIDNDFKVIKSRKIVCEHMQKITMCGMKWFIYVCNYCAVPIKNALQFFFSRVGSYMIFKFSTGWLLRSNFSKIELSAVNATPKAYVYPPVFLTVTYEMLNLVIPIATGFLLILSSIGLAKNLIRWHRICKRFQPIRSKTCCSNQ